MFGKVRKRTTKINNKNIMADIYNLAWKKGDVIRNKETGKPMLVVHVFTRFATMAVDLEDKNTPSIPLVILMRDYNSWALDVEMDYVKKNNNYQWQYSPLMAI